MFKTVNHKLYLSYRFHRSLWCQGWIMGDDLNCKLCNSLFEKNWCYCLRYQQAVPTQEQNTNELSASNTTMQAVPTQEQNTTEISASNTTMQAVPTQEQNTTEISASNTTMQAVPTQEQNTTEISASNTAMQAVPTQEQNTTEISASNTTMQAVPTQEQNTTEISASDTTMQAVPTQEQNTTEISASDTTMQAVPTQEQNTTTVQSSTKKTSIMIKFVPKKESSTTMQSASIKKPTKMIKFIPKDEFNAAMQTTAKKERKINVIKFIPKQGSRYATMQSATEDSSSTIRITQSKNKKTMKSPPNKTLKISKESSTEDKKLSKKLLSSKKPKNKRQIQTSDSKPSSSSIGPANIVQAHTSSPDLPEKRTRKPTLRFESVITVNKSTKPKTSYYNIKGHLNNGRYELAINSILKTGEPAKIAFRNLMKRMVKTELETFLERASIPEVNDSSSTEDVNWNEITRDMFIAMPSIMDTIQAIMPKSKTTDRKYVWFFLLNHKIQY